MSNFNYMPVSPYTNPARDIEKVTNEMPAAKKATTRTRKKATKTTSKRTRKTKKAEEPKSE